MCVLCSIVLIPATERRSVALMIAHRRPLLLSVCQVRWQAVKLLDARHQVPAELGRWLAFTVRCLALPCVLILLVHAFVRKIDPLEKLRIDSAEFEMVRHVVLWSPV